MASDSLDVAAGNQEIPSSPPQNGVHSANISRRSSIDPDETQDIIRTDGFPNATMNGKDASLVDSRELSRTLNGVSPAPPPSKNFTNGTADVSPVKMLEYSNNANSMSMAVIPLHRSPLATTVQTARLRLADYDARLIASMRPLSRQDLDKFTDELRLRIMAGKGSRLDKIFKKADNFIEGWFKIVPILSLWESCAQDCSDVLMTFCQMLLKQTVRGSTLVFEKIFTTFEFAGLVLREEVAKTKKENLASPRVSKIVIDMIILILELNCDLLQFLKLSETGSESLGKLSLRLSTFMIRWTILHNNFRHELWELEVIRDPGQYGIDIRILRAWLASQETGIKPGTQQPTPPPYEDISLDWLRELTTKFKRSENSMLIITGESGVGKSALMASIVDMIKLSAVSTSLVMTFHVGKSQHFAAAIMVAPGSLLNLLTSLEPTSRAERSEINLVKFLLLQLFDRSIGDMNFFQRLCDAYVEVERNRISSPEVLLWGLFREYIRKEKGEVYILIDGLNKIEGGVTMAMKIRGILYDTCISRRQTKSIILSEQIFFDFPPGCEHFHIDPRTIYKDLHLFLEKRIRTSTQLQFLSRREVDEILKRFVNRKLTTFLEVDLFISWLELHRSFDEILYSLRDVPKTLDELIDCLVLRIDFQNRQTRALLSWLLVAEQVVTAHELVTLLGKEVEVPRDAEEKEALYLQSLCSSLLKIRGVSVQFVHPRVKERMLDLASKWKISMRLTDAHATALSACVGYIKLRIGDNLDALPFWDESQDNLDPVLRSNLAKDSVLDYSIRYYIIHFQRSELTADQVIKKIGGYFVDSVDLATYERFCWRTQAYGAALESLHNMALRLRINLLGKSSRSLVQTLISLALMQVRSGSDETALTYIGEAWEVSRSLGAALDRVSRDLAIRYFKIYQSLLATGEEAIAIGIVENVLQYLWDADEAEHGSAHPDTLARADLLKTVLKNQGKYQQVVKLLQRLYETFAKKLGKFDERAIACADELIELRTRLGQYGEVRQFCEDMLLDMSDVIHRWDKRRVKIVLRLVEYYEISNQRSTAITRLRDEWKPLLKEAPEVRTIEIFTALLQITVKLCAIIALTGSYKEIDEVVDKTWALAHDVLTEDIELRKYSRELAQACMRAGRYESVLPILEKLSSIYLEDLSGHYQEAVEVAIALVTCYQKLGKDPKDVENAYKKLLDIFISLELRQSACIILAIRLMDYYQANARAREAMDICRKVLSLFWTQILKIDTTEPSLPNVERSQTLSLAFKLAALTASIGSAEDAVHVYDFIWRACRRSLAITDVDLWNAAKQLSAIYEQTKRYIDAVNLWKGFRADCIVQLGPVHPLVQRVTEQLVLLYLTYKIPNSEEMLLEIIRVGGDSPERYCRQPTLKAILSLIELYEEKKQYDQARSWYYELWTALRFYRQVANVEADIVFDVFERYRNFLLLIKDNITIISIARDLRVIFQSDHGNLSLYYMKAAYELAIQLELDNTSYREAVLIYEELCRIPLDTAADRIEMLKIAQNARLRLRLLYAKYPEYADKAEKIFIEGWRISLRIHGPTQATTMVSFTEIIEYYRKRDTGAATNSALALLDEYIIAILKVERNEKVLFAMAEYISAFYITLKSVKVCRRIMKDIRGEFLGLGGDTVRKFRFETSGIALFDRRCFVFILAVEQITGGKPKEGLYTSVIELLFTEVALYEAWYKATRSSQTLQIRLIAGIRLLNFLEMQHYPLESHTLHKEIWKVFQDSFGPLVNTPGRIKKLCDILISELGRQTIQITVVEALSEASMELWLTSNYNGCLELLQWIRSYYVPHNNLDRQALIRIGFQLSGIISGTGKSKGGPSSPIIETIRKLVFDIILHMFDLDGQESLDFTGLKPSEINILIEVLLLQNDMKTLERIFQALWDSRTFRDWSARITVGFGKRLCWAKYENRNIDGALDLIEDICYNLQDTYGDTHPWTIECKSLQAQLHGNEGSYDKALVVHGGVLQDLLKSLEAGVDVPKNVSTDVVHRLQSLKAVYYFAGNWGSKGEDYYVSIARQASERLSNTDHAKDMVVLGDPSKWSYAAKKGEGVNLLSMENGVESSPELNEAKNLVHWTRPTDWKLPEDVMIDEVNTVNGDTQVVPQGYRFDD